MTLPVVFLCVIIVIRLTGFSGIWKRDDKWEKPKIPPTSLPLAQLCQTLQGHSWAFIGLCSTSPPVSTLHPLSCALVVTHLLCLAGEVPAPAGETEAGLGESTEGSGAGGE